MRAPQSPPGRTLAVEWAVIAGGAALLATALDGVLLQWSKGFFTGGFLSVDHASTWGVRLSFLAGSLAADFAVTGVCAGLVLVSPARRLRRHARRFLCAMAAIAPIVLADVVAYEVTRYLGDTFDVGLMLDLVGGQPGEILAVAAGHVLRPVGVVTLAAAAVAALTWILHRSASKRDDSRGVQAWPRRRVASAMACAALTGIVSVPALRLAADPLDNGLRRKPSAQILSAIVSVATDVDRDGFGLLSRPPDPAPWNAAIHPYALDIPGNGVDEDGVAGDLPPGEPYVEPSGAAPRFTVRPDMVLVMLETFRADLLGGRVGGRPITPILNAMAERGVSAPRAFSHNGYTIQSRQHLFTGSLAGLRGTTTLIDDFAGNGYQTAYFSAQDESFGAAGGEAWYERAEVFYDARQDRRRRYTAFATPGSLGVSSEVLLERIGTFLETRDTARPLFLYVNFYDTHFPYTHPGIRSIVSDVRLRETDIGPGRASELASMYRNTAANVDAAVGALLDRVRRHTGRDPAVVVLADHGESLFDGGFLGHGYAIDDAQTRIPLVVSNLPVRLPDPAAQADVRDVLWEALGTTASEAGTARLVARDGAPVFQYVGRLDRPRLIAFTRADARTIFDFRDGRASVAGGEWLPTDALDAAGRNAVVALVRYWERLRLARAQAPTEIHDTETDAPAS